MPRKTRSEKFSNRMKAAVVDSTSSGTRELEFGEGIPKQLPKKLQGRLVKVQAGKNHQLDRQRNDKVSKGTFSKKKKLESASAHPRYLDSDTSLNSTRNIIHGQKRNREGVIKQHQLIKVEISRGHGNYKQSPSEVLLNEILDLGGTQEDFELVKDMESEDEIMGAKATGKVGKRLGADLERLMAEMGYGAAKLTTQQVVADDEFEGEVEECEDSEESEHRQNTIQGIDTKPQVAETLPTSISYNRGNLLFSPRPDWHAHEPLKLDVVGRCPSTSSPQSLHTRGKELLERENSLYSTTHLGKTSDRQFLSTIMTSGTLSDKVSALTLVCQESPLHTTKTLETLLSLSKKKSRSQSVVALAAVKDLFASGVILPSDRKLRPFIKQPGLGCNGVTDLHLLVWAFEDWLKKFYFEILKVLEGLCSDQLEFARSHAVGYVWELLKEKPEQEANLLRLLVNKLGDTSKKISSKVSFLLLQLQQTHPAMKVIIINAIETEVLFRPGNSAHAKYYAMITLNQTIISSQELKVANKLLDLYFAVFSGLLSKNRHLLGKEQITTAKEASHKKNANTIKRLSRKEKRKLEETERRLQANEELDAKLISAVLTGVNRAYPFSKIDDTLFEKHVDTLFKITHSGNFNTCIQALMLINQVSTSKQIVSNRFYRTLYESLSDQRLITSSKQAMYLNLLFRALKMDSNIRRVRAFVKRLVQVSTLHQPAFICGVFYLLSELESTLPSLRTMLDTPEFDEGDEEEIFRDVSDEEDDTRNKLHTVVEERKKEAKEAVKLYHSYDGRKRDPEFANADKSCLWEIIPFIYHFHPSVALYASRFLYKQAMPNKPDLSLHTLTHFLDRFVFRNPSTRKITRGHSIMQPLPGTGSNIKGIILSIRDTGKTQQPINSEQFLMKKVQDVAPDEVFFHKYFTHRGAEIREKNRRTRDRGNLGKEAEEEDIWSAMVDSRPELVLDDNQADMDDMGLIDMGESDGIEGVLQIPGDAGYDGNDRDAGGQASVSLDSVIFGPQKRKSPAPPNSQKGGSDTWESEDDSEMWSNIDMDLDKTLAVELETNNSGRTLQQRLTKPLAGKKGKTGITDKNNEDGNVKKHKKQKLKHLPTFAAAEDYADLILD